MVEVYSSVERMFIEERFGTLAGMKVQLPFYGQVLDIPRGTGISFNRPYMPSDGTADLLCTHYYAGSPGTETWGDVSPKESTVPANQWSNLLCSLQIPLDAPLTNGVYLTAGYYSCTFGSGGYQVCVGNNVKFNVVEALPCIPKTCNDFPNQCGTFSDGCGGSITCICRTGYTCSGGVCVPLTPPLYEYYNAGDDGSTATFGAIRRAQTFTVGATAHMVTSVKLLLYREGSPGTVTVSIRATDGYGHPTGHDLTSGTTDGNTLPTISPGEWREIALTEYSLSANTKYAIVIRAPSGSAGIWLLWRYDGTSPTYTGGNTEISSDSGSTWSSYTTEDYMFEVWGGVITPPEKATINIDTTPVKGEVLLNGVSQGIAPVSLSVDPGTYIISFGDISGYTTPSPQTIIVIAGEIRNVFGEYIIIPPPPPGKGTLTVNTISVAGDIYVNGTLVGIGSFTGDFDPGVYTVSFGDVVGYVKPSSQTATITEGQITTITGTYTKIQLAGMGWIIMIPIVGGVIWWLLKGRKKA